MIDPMSGFPLTWLAMAVSLGALCAAPLQLRERITVIVALGVFALAAQRCKPPRLRSAMAAALVAASYYSTWRTRCEDHLEASRTARFTGAIVEKRAMAAEPDYYEYRLNIEHGPTVVFSSHSKAGVGDRATVRGRLEPFDGPRNPGEPSQDAIERENGVEGHIESAQILSYSPAPPSVTTSIAKTKAWALSELQKRLGDPASAIVAGELWGERGSLPPDLRAEFQETGTVHILVTAGLHVGLVAAMLVMLCAACGVPRVPTCALAIGCVWAFAAASGLHVPALRAATMASTTLLARAFGRAAFSWNSLGAAVIVVIADDPTEITSASFWLSFCCVGAIFAIASELDARLERVLTHPRAREALVLTIATQLGTWPVTAAIFLQFTPYAILANIAVVPFVPLTMGLGAAQLAFFWFSALAQACANLNGWVVAWNIGVVRTIGALPGASLAMTPAPPWALAFYELA
ncbi:MAG: ComEC/Rec2 family competence protein, partial [Candidatus Eremiobacteraeota bacterium]|nr:ComEC/Rec2 family competence protein [Candidatus Eremiobacteraeota bacterium]